MTDTLGDHDTREFHAILAALGEAWGRADGAGFAAAFTGDADFVNILGMAFRGRDAITAQHQQIFDTIYKGSLASFELVSSRKLADGVTLAHVAATLNAPGGPRPGITRTMATAVLVKADAAWRIAAFQNTVVVTPPV
jgi:uncharacterized protein (TIGR02246 family)